MHCSFLMLQFGKSKSLYIKDAYDVITVYKLLYAMVCMPNIFVAVDFRQPQQLSPPCWSNLGHQNSKPWANSKKNKENKLQSQTKEEKRS